MSGQVWLPGARAPIDAGAARRVWAGALCAQTDPELFFPARGDGATSRRARQVCGRCEVRAECLTTFGPVIDDGIVGGLTAGQRQALRGTGGLPRSA